MWFYQLPTVHLFTCFYARSTRKPKFQHPHTTLLFVGTRARSCVQTVYFFSYLFRYRTDYWASLSSPREESRDIICVHIIRAILRHHELWRRLGAWQEESWDKLQSLPVRKRTFRAQLRRSLDSYVISCTRTRSTRVFFSTRCPVFLFVDFFLYFRLINIILCYCLFGEHITMWAGRRKQTNCFS